MQHHFLIDLTLYLPEDGGRVEPITREGFGCPCKLNDTFADCRLLLSGQQIAPGETKRAGIRFSFEPAAASFRAAGKFCLSDGRIIGEGIVSPSKRSAALRGTPDRYRARSCRWRRWEGVVAMWWSLSSQRL